MTPGVMAARFLAASPSRSGALLGAGVGAAVGGLRADAGENRAQAAWHGALRGGALGAVAGTANRVYRDARLLDPSLRGQAAIGASFRRVGQGVKNFGRRQLYGLTGVGDPDAIGMAGKATAARRAQLLEARMHDEVRRAPRAAGGAIRERAAREIANVRDAGAKSQALQDAGVTSLPGIAKALATKGRRVGALKAMGRSVADGPGGLAWAAGVPLAVSAPSLMKGDETAAGGLSTRRKLLNLGTSIGTGVAFGGLPLVPQMVAGVGTDLALNRLGTRRPQREQASISGGIQ